MAKIVPMQKKDNSFISGLPLAAVLQILGQEQQTCSLLVTEEDKNGILFIEDGELIDAETDNIVGIEAANILLSWKDTTIEMTFAEERSRKIHAPLTQILLESTVKQDEAQASSPKPAAPTQQEELHPGMTRLVNAINSIAGIRQYYLLNPQGEMIAQSGQNCKIGDFIAYCILSGSQIRKKLNAKGPNRILISLKSGQSLLIFFSAGIIIGLMLKDNISADNVLEQLKLALKKQ